MKITVINANDKNGVTFHLKNEFLSNFKDAEVTEIYLHNQLRSPCVGCTACFTNGEHFCKDYIEVNKINESLLASDLIIFAYPTFVFHAPATIKNLLDHLGYQWLVHRPNEKMFSKRAVIITQCLGAGSKSAIKDVKDSLSWWGIPEIYTYKGAIWDKEIVWDKISKKRKSALTSGINKLGKKLSKINFSKMPKTSFATKFKFNIVRMMQKSILNKNIDSLDADYWYNNGWLEDNRPWKKSKTV